MRVSGFWSAVGLVVLVLIVTDLVQWWRGRLPWPARLYATLTGVRHGLAVPRTVRALVRDREAARHSAELLMGWDFKRIVLAHDTVVATGAREQMTRAMDWFR